ncbi:Sporulation protein cse60 [Bacillus coahuilensis m2-6]|uniref:Sporulation protein cse60 n=1 Tax=Bacillus coahuilensis p1.1.43 TaxID=1150625 RepID=A0A147K6Q3_9BACI|nr:sporulation protein Cse60 [Bacillus coahuilensis]KUP05547.1 Sporulation protein cse60 [Bacillus coahuilensis p1.1.43]KUP06731.1 Sporulation protein cse60 [Bacillus coahuilensis m2-6]
MLQVRVLDCEHERDLEKEVNEFLKDIEARDIVDIKYQVSTCATGVEQIYCFSAMIIYRE